MTGGCQVDWQPIIQALASILLAIPGAVAAWWAWQSRQTLRNGKH